ncbi:MAG: glycosyltransferase [Chloroflexi bacterium]|nr:glycosyltransferase [Chloroflexota bacterium]
MLEGEGVLCFAPECWDGLWRSRQHIMSVLARRNMVLFVEPRAYLKPVIKQISLRRLSLNQSGRWKLSHVGDHLYVLRQPALAPVSGNFLIGAATAFIRRSIIKRAMKNLRIDNPIVWIERPDTWDEAGRFGEKLLVYRVVDEYSAYQGLTPEARALTREQERWLMDRADLVLVASRSLLASKSQLNPNTYLVPHGVDHSRFAIAMADSRPLPADIAVVPRPIVGYIGLVGARLDLPLLAEIAVSHPDWSLVFVGETNAVGCEEPLRRLERSPNVYFLGRKDVKSVPYYVRAFDVGIIPYRQDEEACHANPLKLLEYLACGKPVVSANILSAREFADVVDIAEHRDSFVTLVERALENKGDNAAVRLRQEVAERNTWERVANTLSEILAAAIERKKRER